MSVTNADATDDPPSVPADSVVSDRVIRAVASAMGVDPIECPPLYDVLDLAALNELFKGRSNPRGRIIFEYAGYEVTVDGDGEIALEELSEE